MESWLVVVSVEQSVGWEKAQYCAHLVFVRSCSCFRASLLIRDPSSFSLIIVSEIWMAGYNDDSNRKWCLPHRFGSTW